jgi:hypothetical protein
MKRVKAILVFVIIPGFFLFDVALLGWGIGLREGTRSAFNYCADFHHEPRPFQ